MSHVSEFFSKGSAAWFEEVLMLYPEAVKAKAAQKKKKKGESLEKLDKWYQEQLEAVVQSRKPPHITQEELVRLVDWKLSRGKFRPRLMDLARSNSEDTVRAASESGLKLASMGKVEKAIDALVVLKGVGPATASAVLAACVPHKCCFFADEVAHALPNLSTLKYTAQEYCALNDAVTQCAKKLDAEKNSGVAVQWTPHRVELAVWSFSILSDSLPDLLPSPPITHHKSSSPQTSPQPPKKKKRQVK